MIVIKSERLRRAIRRVVPLFVVPALALSGAVLTGRGQYALVISLVCAASFLLFAAGFAVVFGVTVAVSMVRGKFYQDAIDAFTPGVAMMACGIYGLVSALYRGREPRHAKAVLYLSKASFCIFLVHHFYVMLLRTYLYAAYKYLCIVVIPAQALAVLALSILTYELLRRIPWVKDNLI